MSKSFQIHKYADKSDPNTLHADLPGAPPGTWPIDRVEWTGEPPNEPVRISMHYVLNGIKEGWIQGENHDVVTRPAGPPHNPWGETVQGFGPHVFHHFSHLTICGTVFEVTHQPDKYADYEDATDPSKVKKFNADDSTKVTTDMYDAGATRVDWFYVIEKVDE